jgi:hypothetical protein
MRAALNFKGRLSIDHDLSDDGFVTVIGLFFQFLQAGLNTRHF